MGLHKYHLKDKLFFILFCLLCDDSRLFLLRGSSEDINHGKHPNGLELKCLWS
jgi:hypothetical protein